MSEKTLSKYEQHPYFLTAGVTVTDGKPVVYLRTSGFNDEELKAIRGAFEGAFHDALCNDLTGTPEKIATKWALEIDDEGNIQ